MAIFTKANSILKRLKRDESGTAALSWAVSMTVVLGAMGAAMDFAVLSSADAKSQAIADTTALAAAIYVKTNGRAPSQEGELTEGDHTAADLGYQYKDLIIDGADGVTVNIAYDDDAKEVTTTVYGKTNPILVQVLGITDLAFESQSVASYLDIEDKFPASIALVLDNSGSMQFDDILPESYYKQYFNKFFFRWRGNQASDATIRLDGLKDSVLQFQTDLSDRLGTEDDSGRRTLRMGMLPYSSDIIPAGLRPMDWGYLPVGTPSTQHQKGTGILGMDADGGTNSNPPMEIAKTWLEGENTIHKDEAKRANDVDDKDPLKFVIFMTDGQNSVGDREIVPGPTGTWFKETSPGNFSQSGGPLSGYIEGSLRLLTDDQTIENCQQMKDDGVHIFTIGYALEDHGWFRVNGWNNNHNDALFEVKSGVRSAAYNLMESCASEPEHFITAADAGQLEAAFDEIQNAIVLELIRLKS